MGKTTKDFPIGKLRPTQFLVTYGPGAIFNGTRDSVTIKDIAFWDKDMVREMPVIDEPSLRNRLGVEELRGFPLGSDEEDDGADNTKNNDWGLPVNVFPAYHVCRECTRLFKVTDKYEDYDEKKGPLCPNCGGGSYPVGYIVACEDGHMDDFPWSYMVHEGEKCENEELYLEIDENSKKWQPKRIRCAGCDREVSWDTDLWKKPYHCSGWQPQGGPRDPGCQKAARLMRRDSSSVYYPVTQRTISIPARKGPVDDLIYSRFTRAAMAKIQFAEINGTLEDYYQKHFSQDYTWEEFEEAYDRINRAAKAQGSMNKVYENLDRYEVVYDFADVRDMEHYAITHFINDDDNKLSVKEITADITDESKPYFSGLFRIKKLNEVNVLLGFTRREPPDPSLQIKYKVDPDEKDPNDHVCRLANGESNWLPTVLLKGEGIYMELNPDKIGEWLQEESVARLSDIYRNRYGMSCVKRGWRSVQERDAKYVLLHTLAHLLIKELSLYCGYAQPNLRERIYCNDNMNGILIYTDSPDRNGSLGGLEELAEWNRFAPILKAALKNAIICPQDPQCSLKSPAADIADARHSMNGAACYSCAMVPEISCENMNQLLDRALVVPLTGREEAGFFTEDYIDSLPN